MTSLGSDQLNCDSQKKEKKKRSIELWKHKNINLPSWIKKVSSTKSNSLM